jgi:hypothetical protein
LSPVRFFIDASMVGVGKLLAEARPDVTYPGHSDCPFGPEAKEPEWIPVVAERAWVVLMRDKRARWRLDEKRAIVEHGLRAFILTSAGNMSVWDQLRLVITSWDRMEEKLDERPAGPYAFAVTWSGLRDMEIG